MVEALRAEVIESQEPSGIYDDWYQDVGDFVVGQDALEPGVQVDDDVLKGVMEASETSRELTIIKSHLTSR